MHDEDEESISVITIPLILIPVGIFLFIALLQRDRDLTLWAALVLGITGCAKLWSLAGFRNLKYSTVLERPRVFPGEILTLRISAQNEKFLPVLVGITIPTVPGGIEAAGGDAMLHKETGLLWHQRADFTWDLTAVRRGVHNLGPCNITAGDFLGFYRKERRGGTVSVIVYPRISPINEISLPNRDIFGRAGKTSPVQDPVYILGTRDYQHWQPARYIHWKASARYDRLMEKVFDPSEQEKVLLAIETGGFSRNGAAGEFEKTLEAAASLAVYLERRGLMVGLATNASLSGGGKAIIRPGRNTRQLTAILETMARMEMNCSMSLRETIRRGGSLSWGTSCVLFACKAEDIPAEGVYFQNRGIPFTGVAALFPDPAATTSPGGILCLDDIISRNGGQDDRG